MSVASSSYTIQRPHLRVSVARPRASEWQNGQPAFLVAHERGSPASAIQIAPIKFLFDPGRRICFRAVALLDQHQNTAVLEAVVQSAKTDEEAAVSEALFRSECQGARFVSYPMHARFAWHTGQDEEWFSLVWDDKARTLNIVPLA